MALKNRFDFMFFFDVENGNPNGDPDNNNLPRYDERTGLGYVTDVCLKRKIRDYVGFTRDGEDGYDILVKSGDSLNNRIAAQAVACGMEKKGKYRDEIMEKKVRDFMCQKYFDVRTFGAVLQTGDYPIGCVRGPVQLAFAKSVSPIDPQEIRITRCCRTKDEDRLQTYDNDMGTKAFIHYGLYCAQGWISAEYGSSKTGITEEDVNLIWEAIMNLFENDHSAARGKMCTRKLFVFKHDSIRGNSPSHILFEKVKAKKKDGVVYPSKYDDYEITVDRDMPKGVELIEML